VRNPDSARARDSSFPPRLFEVGGPTPYLSSPQQTRLGTSGSANVLIDPSTGAPPLHQVRPANESCCCRCVVPPHRPPSLLESQFRFHDHLFSTLSCPPFLPFFFLSTSPLSDPKPTGRVSSIRELCMKDNLCPTAPPSRFFPPTAVPCLERNKSSGREPMQCVLVTSV